MASDLLELLDDPDAPRDAMPMGRVGHLRLSEIIFGAATFSSSYNTDAVLESGMPLRTVRLALQYGIRTFDTSPFYGRSEAILGHALNALESEFPRSSYQLMTKCGRYVGLDRQFDYSPAWLRASVNLSLSRLKTGYLDTVYLHDVEFVCTPVTQRAMGNPVHALEDEKEDPGLAEGHEGMVRGKGDQIVLDAIAELRKMQDEGLIKNIGISGYPLPTLLRIALLVLHSPPFKPLDVVLSYAHLTIQNTAFEAFIPHLRERAQVQQLVTASPLTMGLLSLNVPSWHPAPTGLREVISEEMKQSEKWTSSLANLALGYSVRKAIDLGLPLAVGMSNLCDVHECMSIWTKIASRAEDENRRTLENDIRERISQSGFLDWSWPSP